MAKQLSVFRAALAALTTERPPRDLSMVDNRGSWQSLFSLAGNGSHDFKAGTWQKDLKITDDRALSFFAVFACVTQIASDIAKLCYYLMKLDEESGIWQRNYTTTTWPFFKKPNHFQTRQQFVECWQISKQTKGNAVALKERDARGVPSRQYLLDWDRVTPMVATDGSVWYQLQTDNLSHLPGPMVYAPASEIIHDRMNCLFHPLIGISPLYAGGLAANQGLKIQTNSAKFFSNMSRPSGVLTAPGRINDETAKRLKDEWEKNFGDGQIGRTAVLGDALKYEQMAVTPENAQLVEQLDLSARQVCSAFKVPPFMVGLGDPQGFANVGELKQFYYDRCLQPMIEGFENTQDEGLELPAGYRTQFDLDDLLRMDPKTAAEVEGSLVKFAIKAPNEARRRFDLLPKTGGDSPMIQQQNYSLDAIAKRDSGPDPFATAKAPAPPAPAPAPEPDASVNNAALVEIRAAVENLQATSSAAAELAAAENGRREAAERALTEELAAQKFLRRLESRAHAA